jgi:hypothetical protein
MTRLPTRAALTALISIAAVGVVPSAAFGQATRTWVSGVGDDVNPCSRTAPCKTFAGAISKTAAKGEINVLDPGGFGAVTITKSISIRARGNTAGVLTNAANAINVSAGVNDRVTLSGLDINGLGTATAGVKINSGKVIKIEKSEIFGFTTNGVSFASSTANSKLIIQDTLIAESGTGVGVSPTGAGASVSVRHSTLDDNTNGIAAASGAQPAIASVFNSNISDNTNGVFSTGALADIRIGNNNINGNGTGLLTSASGKITSFGNNNIFGNGTDGNPTNNVLPK